MSNPANNKTTSRATLCAIFGALAANGAVAQDDKGSGSIYDAFENGPFSAEFSAGVEYDSNVSVIEIDTSTAQDDFAAVFDFGLGVETKLGENTKIKVGYDFGQDIQFDFSAFDTQSHRGSAEISHDFGAVDTGVSYQYVYSKLGGAGFLRMHRLSPYAAAYVANKKAYLRASYIYTDKDFIGRLDRDSEVNAGSAEAFYFLNGLKTYVITGYRYESDDAFSPEFDFESHNVKVRFIQRIPFGAHRGKLRVGWRYEDRNYNSITPSIAAIRDDERHRFDASLEIPFSDIVYGELEYRYDDFSSNLPSADFTQNVATIRLGGRL